MIQNFNFYDIYGNLLPGLTLLMLLWLPFGLITGRWPSTELASAILAIAFGYIAGHIVQALATRVVPSKLKDSKKHPRYPSDIILDSDDNTFSANFKTELGKRIQSEFGLDVKAGATDAEHYNPNLSPIRQDAFFLCRAVLIKAKTASYAEQFEGLYALMRGLAATFAAGLVYHAGWASAGLSPKVDAWSWVGIVAGLAFAFIAEILTRIAEIRKNGPLKSHWWVLAFLFIALFALGNYLGLGRITTGSQRELFLIISLAGLFVALRCFTAYKVFTMTFARTVYRDFYHKEQPESGKPSP